MDFLQRKALGRITIEDFLTADEIKRCFELKKAGLIVEEIIKPNIDRINKKLGQENDCGYLGYACEYVVTETERRNK